MSKQQTPDKIITLLKEKYAANSDIINIIGKLKIKFNTTKKICHFYSSNNLDIVILKKMEFTKTVVSLCKEKLNLKIKCFLEITPKKQRKNLTPKKTKPEKINPAPVKKENVKSTGLNKDLNFKNLVTANYNKICVQAARKICKEITSDINPFFVFGRSGLGKTHLINAIGLELANKQNKTVFFYSANSFATMIAKLTGEKNKAILKFKEHIMHDCDVLIIDDIQFNANRKKTNEILFEIHEYFLNHKKQIIYASDVHPRDYKDFDERLVSRFTEGLIIKISDLDIDSSILILKRKLNDDLKVNFSDESLDFIAKRFKDSVRDLIGVVKKIKFYVDTDDNIKSYDKALVKKIVADIAFSYSYEDVSVDKIITTVCSYFNVDPKEIKSNSKKQNIVQARRFIIYLIKEHIHATYVNIANYVGLKTHSSVINNYNNIKKNLPSDQEMTSVLNNIKEIIKLK